MSSTADKARALRLERLQSSVDHFLEHTDAALETLMSELQLGELRHETWEALHAAAARDGKEADLARAYEKITVERRLKQLAPTERAALLSHAADFHQGILGDAATAERYLWRVLEVTPDHTSAFARLERRFSAEARDRVRLCELYGLVASSPPKPPAALARAANDIVSVLPSLSPLPDDACRKLLQLSPVSQPLLTTLETHCRKTGRFTLACELLETSLTTDSLTEAEATARRHRLVELYLGDAKAPEKSVSHVEALLTEDPSDAPARAAADRLLRVREVAARAAAALRTARSALRERGGV